MGIYLSAYIVVIGFTYLSDKVKLKMLSRVPNHGLSKSHDFAEKRGLFLSALFYCISALILIVIRGFRYGIGIDAFHSYLWKFNAAVKGNVVWGDPIYAIFIQLCSKISTNPTIFYLLDSALFVGIIYYAISKINNKRTVFVALFCASYHYLRSFNLQAQYLAMAISLLTFVMLLIKEQKVLGVLSSVLALGVHSSSIVVILPIWMLFILLKVTNVNKIYLIISCIIPIIAILYRGILPTVTEVLLQNTRFAVYIGSKYDVGGFSKYLFVLNLSIYILYLAAFQYSIKRNCSSICKCGLVLQSCALSATLVYGVIPLMDRITYYFMFFQILSLPHMLSLFDNKKVYIGLILMAVSGLFVLEFAYLIPKDSDHIDPYVSIFSDEKAKYDAFNEPTVQPGTTSE